MIKLPIKVLVNSLLRPLDFEIVRSGKLPVRLFDFGEGEYTSPSSHFSLVLVGAHDGSKMKTFIRRAAAVGLRP